MLYPQYNESRETVKLDGFWQFRADRENVGETELWCNGLTDTVEMSVPGSWNEQSNDLFDFIGKGWYEKSFFVPKNWESKAVWLRFGSGGSKTRVWVNGELLGSHIGGHLPFEYDISDKLSYGAKNKVVVLIDCSLDPWSLPPAMLGENEGQDGFTNSYPAVTYDFYPYGGIHRSVFLYTTSKNRINDVTITTDVEKGVASVNYSIVTEYEFAGKISVKLENQIIEHELNGEKCISGKIIVENPNLWDTDNPFLYELELGMLENECLTDSYSQTFGIRTIEINGNKLLLNGKEIKLKGFGKHEDFPVLGKGHNGCVVVKDFHLMKWIGANSFRTAHYPYDENILDYADRNGVLVIDETPFVGLSERMYKPEILQRAKAVIKELIERDKNHPSVIMWSMANEPDVPTPEGEEFFKEMYECARSLDSSRPVTYVAHLEPENNLGMKYYDIICINKYYGWYIGPGQVEGTLQQFSDCLDRFHRAFGKPMIVTEFGADAISGMHSLPAQMFTEEYQCDIIKSQIEVMEKKEYCVGCHVWTFADFKANQTIARVVVNRKGVFSRDREPKAAAYMLRELWTGNK